MSFLLANNAMLMLDCICWYLRSYADVVIIRPEYYETCWFGLWGTIAACLPMLNWFLFFLNYVLLQNTFMNIKSFIFIFSDEMNIRFYNEALWLLNLFLALDSSSNLISFFYEGLLFSSVWEIASNIICFSFHD